MFSSVPYFVKGKTVCCQRIGKKLVSILRKNNYANTGALSFIMASEKNHVDPTVRNLWKLQEMAKQDSVPEDVKQQIDRCISSYFVRDDFCDKMSSPASDEVSHIMDETINHPWEKVRKECNIPVLHKGMISGKLEGNFLKTLVSMSNAKKVLELGLFTGCGALTMAEALPADGSVTTCELTPYVQDLARKLVDRSPHGYKIKIKGGPALTTLEELANAGEQFDIIFIDADKNNYLNYYKMIMDRNLLSPRGTILADNALFQGVPYCKEGLPEQQVKRGEGIREFDEFVSKDERVYKVLVPLRDGVFMIRRKSDVEGTVNKS